MGGLAKIVKSSSEEKKELIEIYFTTIMNEKISEMNLGNQDVAQAAELIKKIFDFLRPV